MIRLAPNLYADLIGKPYREDARGPEAYDCLGLAIELQRRQGRDVPNFRSTAEEFAAQYGEGLLGPCVQISAPVPGCAALFRMIDDERHLGTMLDRFCMMHTQAARRAGAGSAVIEQIRMTPWERRLLGFYVPRDARPEEVEP